jgi:hypothetical protein
MSGDLSEQCTGSANASSDSTGLTLELIASSSSEVFVLFGTASLPVPGTYRVWGDDCDARSEAPAEGEVVFRINAQGGVAQQWTLSAHHGSVVIERVDSNVIIGHFEAQTCAERIGSAAELAVVLHGGFYIQR